MNMEHFTLERRDQVATVHMYNLTDSIVAGRTLDFHWGNRSGTRSPA